MDLIPLKSEPKIKCFKLFYSINLRVSNNISIEYLYENTKNNKIVLDTYINRNMIIVI